MPIITFAKIESIFGALEESGILAYQNNAWDVSNTASVGQR